jgi:hypothetical protein
MCLLALVLTAGVVAARQPAPAAPGTGLIAGQVLDVTSGRPVPGVEVNLNRALAARPGTGRSATGPIPVLTDSQGRFAFSSLVEGQYSLVTTPRNQYVPVRGAFVTLAADQRVTDVTLRVGRYGSIAGTVLDDAGDPVVGISVRAFNRRNLFAMELLFPRGSAVTDDRGQFRMGDLPAADYLVCACAKDPLPIDKDLLTRMAAFTIPAAAVAKQVDDTVLTFAPTFYPGNRLADAIPVTVGYGDSVMGISVTVRAVTPRRVTGRITGGGANAGTRFTLVLFPENEDPAAMGLSEVTPANVTPDGAFDFIGVTPGRYTLEVFPADGKPGLSASMAINIDDRDVTNVVVSLIDGPAVRGRVDFPGVAARPDAETMARAAVGLVPLRMTVGMMISIGASGSGTVYRSQLGADGSFTISGVRPGQYRVQAGQFGGKWTTVESVLGPGGLSEYGLVTVPSDGVDGLLVTMSDAAQATLDGTIALGRHEWSNDMRVLVFPVDRTFWANPNVVPGRFLSNGASNAPAFTFQNVPPGDYYVVVVDQDMLNMSERRLQQLAPRATTVTLRAGQTTTVSLKR